MKKIVYLALSMLLIAAALTGCAAASADKTYGKDDKDIAVSAGDMFTIELEANPTTGYDWSINVSDESIVKLESQEYQQQPGSEELVGAGGTDIFTFKGIKAGSATITFIYERSFEQESAVETLLYNVTVK
jgi:inhibitor of cysteine peptidase